MLGMSQTTLADAADVTFQQVQKYEKGINRVSASRMQQFAKILDVPVSYFFEEAPEAHVFGDRKSSAKPGSTSDYVTSFIRSREGHDFMKAFSRISDRKLRGTLIALAEDLASR